MADFCNKCSGEMGFPEPDIDVYKIWESLKQGYFESCLCEGCGMRGVARSENDELFVIFLDENDDSIFLNYDDYKGLKINNDE
jgi:hypothetical protein